MSNTKTYYLEGTLQPKVTLTTFKDAVAQYFHSTYCVAEIVELTGGYLGVEKDDGPFLVAAIHSYSLIADQGPDRIAPLFREMIVHRLDRDWSDLWVREYNNGKPVSEYRTPAPLAFRDMA